MIRVVTVESTPAVPTHTGRVSRVLDPAADRTRVQVDLEEVDPGKTRVIAPDTSRTQVVYIVDGTGARITTTAGGRRTEHPARRRCGVYLEPGEDAAVTASATPLRLLLVTVPKHTGKAAGGGHPSGYFFEEARLRALVDEKRIRERTFWVNTETGLSESWDLQLGRMLYAPGASSPRHVHHPSPTSTVAPEHFYLIEKGEGEVKHDTGTLPVGPGSLVFIPAGAWHQLIASETGLDYVEFQAPFDFVTTMDHDPLGKNWYIKGTDDGTGKPVRWVQS